MTDAQRKRREKYQRNRDHNKARDLALYHSKGRPEKDKRRKAARAKQVKVAGYEPTCCEICQSIPDKPLHFDHNHSNGKFRGWLCELCNKGLGLFKDNPERLTVAAEYIRTRGLD